MFNFLQECKTTSNILDKNVKQQAIF